MKKYLSFAVILIPFLCSCNQNNFASKESIIDSQNESIEPTTLEVIEMKINILINGTNFIATLEDTETGKAFYEMIGNELVLNLEEYGGFEKVGSLGKSLPRNDVRITTKPGDLILYNGSEFSLMYGSNTWSYTKIGKIDNTNSLIEKVGSGDIKIKITKNEENV